MKKNLDIWKMQCKSTWTGDWFDSAVGEGSWKHVSKQYRRRMLFDDGLDLRLVLVSSGRAGE